MAVLTEILVNKMLQENARFIRVGEWVFEVKTVRALRVDEYGKPYSAIANCNLNGDTMYIDGLLTKEDQDFSKEDFLTFHKFSKRMGIEGFSYHRYHNGESVTKDVKVEKTSDKSIVLDSKSKKVDDKPTTLDVPMRLVT